MFKSLLTASVVSASLVAPAFAGDLKGSYVGVGAAISTNSAPTSVAINGRVDSRDLGSTVPISVRPQVTIASATGGSVGVTYDLGIANNVNLFAGGGAGFGAGTSLNTTNQVVGFVQVGAEGAVAQNVVLFTDLKVGFGGTTSYVPTVGIGYKF